MKATISPLPLECDLPPSIQDNNYFSLYNIDEETDVIKEGYNPLSPQNTNNQHLPLESDLPPSIQDNNGVFLWNFVEETDVIKEGYNPLSPQNTNNHLPLESDLPPLIQDNNDFSLYDFVEETDVIKEGYNPLSPQNTNNHLPMESDLPPLIQDNNGVLLHNFFEETDFIKEGYNPLSPQNVNNDFSLYNFAEETDVIKEGYNPLSPQNVNNDFSLYNFAEETDVIKEGYNPLSPQNTNNQHLPLESNLPPSIQDNNDFPWYNFVEETYVIKEGYKSCSPQNTNNQNFENGTIMQPRDSESVKTVPKIILKRVSSESNYFEIKSSKRKKKKKKRKHSKRKSPIRSETIIGGSTENGTLQPFETVWISDNDEVLKSQSSDNEINNNEVCIENDVQVCLDTSTEMYSDIQIQLNDLNGIYLEFKATEALITELAEALYLIISAQKDRLQRQQKCANLSLDFISKEKCLAEEEFEKVVTNCGPRFTEYFKRLEENLPCLRENPGSAYLHILQQIFDGVRKIDETIQATIEEVRNLLVSILRENNHNSEVFDFLTDDHNFFNADIF